MRQYGTHFPSFDEPLVKQRNIASLKHKASDEEWETVLSYFLLRKQPEGDKTNYLDGVRMEYSLKGEVLRVTIRRDVQGIKVEYPAGAVLYPG